MAGLRSSYDTYHDTLPGSHHMALSIPDSRRPQITTIVPASGCLECEQEYSRHHPHSHHHYGGHSMMVPSHHERALTPREQKEKIMQSNLAFEAHNRSIPPLALYSQVHPKMRSDGSFPRDFRDPRTVEEIELLDNCTIDRIMMSYGLLTTQRRNWSRRLKLNSIYEFLGADALVRSDRSERMMDMMPPSHAQGRYIEGW